VAYLKPTWFVRRVFNPIAMKTGIAGTETLAVRRRKSGGILTVPVTSVEHAGARYLVSTRGESDWVRNLRAAGTAELNGTAMSATELPVAERAPILEAYRAKLGKQVESYFTKLPDPADHPVFRLEPR
jgi:hypothetical protein